MADTQVTSFTTLTGAGLATGDLFPVIDISASGTAKNAILTTTELVAGLKLNGIAGLAANTFTGIQTYTPASDSGDTIKINSAAAALRLSLGTVPGLTTYGAIYGNVTPSISNYALTTNGVNTIVNTVAGYAALASSGVVYFAIGNGAVESRAHTTFGLSAGPVNVLANASDVILTRIAAGQLGLGYTHATNATAQCIKAHNVTTGTGASLTLGGGTGSTAGGAVNLATSITTGALVNHITVAANGDIVIGTSASRKVGFFGAAPVVQQTVGGVSNSTGGSANATLSAVTDTTATDQSGVINDNFTELHTFTENVRAALATLGLFA